MLLFGLPLTRIVALRREDISSDDVDTRLWIQGRSLRLPPQVAHLVTALSTTPIPARGTVPGAATTSSLLFPGRTPTRPLRPATLSSGLARHGIAVLPARNSARLALADELPAAILADLTGIRIDTAVRWSHRAQHDWTGFVAARADSSASS
jgi:hypothetical protein